MKKSEKKTHIFSFLMKASGSSETPNLGVGGLLKLGKTSAIWHVSMYVFVYEYVVGG